MKMNKQEQLISIITVTYQAAQTIESTIRSVLAQELVYEYIIIDGGSNDSTLEIIKKYEDKITHWISEPDRGIYDAMNKGIRQAKGNWIYFLGSGDELMPDVLSQIRNHLNEDYSVIYGDVCYDTGEKVVSFLSVRTMLQNTLHHQSAFYNKDLFDDFRYDVNLSILSDYELNLRIYRYKWSTHKLHLVIARCMIGGVSSNLSLSLKETNLIRSRYVSSSLSNRILSTILRLYYLQKKIRNYFVLASL